MRREAASAVQAGSGGVKISWQQMSHWKMSIMPSYC